MYWITIGSRHRRGNGYETCCEGDIHLDDGRFGIVGVKYVRGRKTFDLSSMNMEDILSLQSAIGEELLSRSDSVVLTAGNYVVGKDIAAGSYTITPYNGDEERCKAA